MKMKMNTIRAYAAQFLVVVAVLVGSLSPIPAFAALDGAYPTGNPSVNAVRTDMNLELGELFKRGLVRSVSITGTDTIAATSVNVPQTVLSDGLTVSWVAANTNTGAATFNLDTISATALRDPGDVALVAGQIISGRQYTSRYSSATTHWHVINGLWQIKPTTCSGTDKVSAIAANGDVTCTTDAGGAGSGDNISVNGNAATDADFDDATPSAGSNGLNVLFQKDAGTPNNISAYVPNALGLKTISIPGGAIISATTAGCTAAQLESTTNKINQKICGFTSTTVDEFGWFQFTAPKSWDEGTITAQFFWTSASGTGDVVWSLACLARSDDDAMDTALGTAVTVTDTQLTAGDLMISAATSAITVGGTPAENDELFCRVARVGTNGSDTFSGTAQLSAVKVLMTVNALTDN